MLMEIRDRATIATAHARHLTNMIDRCFQRARDVFGDDGRAEYSNARKDKQRDGVTQPPGQPMLDNVTDVRAPRRDAGHRRDMVRPQARRIPSETKT